MLKKRAREDDEAKKGCSGGEEMALTVADDGGGGEAWWKKCGDGLDVVEDVAEKRKMAGGAMMASLQAGVEVEVEVLEAERGEENEGGEDLRARGGWRASARPKRASSG